MATRQDARKVDEMTTYERLNRYLRKHEELIKKIDRLYGNNNEVEELLRTFNRAHELRAKIIKAVAALPKGVK